MNGAVSRAEWRWVFLVAVGIVLISTVPYAAGYLSQTPQLRFAGAVFDLEDYHSHLAKVWLGYRGEWRYHVLFTPEEQTGTYLRPFYIALGHLGRRLGLSVPAVYHLARIVAGVLLLLSVYRFIAWFAEGEVRRVAFLLAATASGLGWLVMLLFPTPAGGISPIDFWLVDAYVFFSLFAPLPHFPIAAMLLLTVYHLLLRLMEVEVEGDGTRRWDVVAMALAPLASVGLGLIHPYALLLADLVPALYLLWRMVSERRWLWPPLLTLAAMGLAQMPLVLYDYLVFTTDPVFRAWAAQNITLSPPPLYYLLGYGPVLIPAAWGWRWAGRTSRRMPFLLIWMAVVAVAVYLPWTFQRRFVEGVLVALCVPAGYGLVLVGESVGRPSRRSLRRLVIALGLIAASVSNLYLVSSYTLSAVTHHPAIFHPADEVAAVEWLGANSTWDETVLASYETGNWIVGAIGHRVVLGHWCETMDYAGKSVQVREFFAGGPGYDRCGLLRRYSVAYVFYGPREREMGPGPEGVPCLSPVLWSGDVVVYRVIPLANDAGLGYDVAVGKTR